MVALAPEPESGDVGALTVARPRRRRRARIGRIRRPPSLAAARQPAGRAGADEVQRLFGDALAALPPPARRFLLYFDIGDDTLTAESRALVPEILATVQARPVPEVSIVGHTDTTGAAAANVDLGLRRAALIRDLLVAPDSTSGWSRWPRTARPTRVVPTPDNTAEARNRRVEVSVR